MSRTAGSHTRGRRSVGFLRAMSGLLAGGLVVLALGLGGAWFVATRSGSAGPGPSVLLWHGLGAVVAVAAQVYADRHPDVRGTAAAALVVAVTAAVLAAQWLF